MKFWLTLIALATPAAASAADPVSLSSQVFVERETTDAEGKRRTVREEPGVVTPGDRLVFQLSYRNGGSAPATGFTVTNPVPAAVRFSAAEGTPSYSVDGGKSWGDLAALTVPLPDGTRRPAQPADVTHVRWSFDQPIAASAAGTLSFRGIVK